MNNIKLFLKINKDKKYGINCKYILMKIINMVIPNEFIIYESDNNEIIVEKYILIEINITKKLNIIRN